MILNVQPAREIFLWLITYTFNIQVSIQGWFPANISHFWTLSVGEQFYIFWPWLVLFAPRRSLIPIICIVSCFGPFYRLYAVANELSEAATYCFTLSALDTLGIGSLLALVSHGGYAKETIERFLARFVLPIGVVATVTLNVLLYSKVDWKAYIVLLDTAVALIFCWLISSASRAFKGPVLTGKVGRNSFGFLLASDAAPGNFSAEERNDAKKSAKIAKFLDKNAYVAVLRLKHDLGQQSSIGMIATSYNFIEKHNQLAGVDGSTGGAADAECRAG